MSAPAILAAAYARRNTAHAVLAEALTASQQAAARAAADAADQAADTARAAADSLARPALLATLAYHHFNPPPPDTADLLSAMHMQSFAPLAEILDSRLNCPHGVLLALRRVWRHHHGRQVDGRRADGLSVMTHDDHARVLRCTTFGEVAFMLEDEFKVADQSFAIVRGLWRVYRGMEGLPAAGTLGGFYIVSV
jgi:hypothetical protein